MILGRAAISQNGGAENIIKVDLLCFDVTSIKACSRPRVLPHLGDVGAAAEGLSKVNRRLSFNAGTIELNRRDVILENNFRELG